MLEPGELRRAVNSQFLGESQRHAGFPFGIEGLRSRRAQQNQILVTRFLDVRRVGNRDVGGGRASLRAEEAHRVEEALIFGGCRRI